MNNSYSASSSSPTKRLSSISSHLKPTSRMVAERDPITCHVLDTTTGRPGASISVTLSPLSSPSSNFTAKTNSDGRVANWTISNSSSSPNYDSAGKAITALIKDLGSQKQENVPSGSSLWKVRFETGEYYGVEKTFFPVVELTFLVKEGEHFHVPLLLGPYSFTTYRGS